MTIDAAFSSPTGNVQTLSRLGEFFDFLSDMVPSIAATAFIAAVLAAYYLWRFYSERSEKRTNVAVALFTELNISRTDTESVLSQKDMRKIMRRIRKDKTYIPSVVQSKTWIPAFEAFNKDIGLLPPATAMAVYRAYEALNSIGDAFDFVGTQGFEDLDVERRAIAFKNIRDLAIERDKDIAAAEKALSSYILGQSLKPLRWAITLGPTESERRFLAALQDASRRSEGSDGKP